MKYVNNDALVSPCGAYRYWLRRTWDEAKPVCTFVMLNPSTADARKDDPTIRKCVGFADRWGYGSLSVVNLFAYRATNPKVLLASPEVVGPDNDRHIRDCVLKSSLVVAAWGGSYPPMLTSRVAEVRAILRSTPTNLLPVCLGHTGGGDPRHPLYVRYGVARIPYE